MFHLCLWLNTAVQVCEAREAGAQRQMLLKSSGPKYVLPAALYQTRIDGVCQGHSQSILCSLDFVMGSVLWLPQLSWLHRFLSRALFVKTSNRGPQRPPHLLHSLRNTLSSGVCGCVCVGRVCYCTRRKGGGRVREVIGDNLSFFLSLFHPFTLFLFLSLSILTQRKYYVVTDSRWIHMVIHRPIPNCQVAKWHRVCQNSYQDRAEDVKN